MICLSAPFHYKEALLLSVYFIDRFTKEKDKVIDLGCSTANTLITLAKYSSKKLNLIGIDNSLAMIEQARKKTGAFGEEIELLHQDFLEINFPKAKGFIANYTLQFCKAKRKGKAC